MSNPTLSPDQHPEDQESLNKLEKAISDNDRQFQEAIQDLTAIANENLNLFQLFLLFILIQLHNTPIKIASNL